MMRLLALLGAIAVTLTSVMSLADAQAFTYQGFLRQSGTPANGSFNMTFRLFDVPSGGTALATVGPTSVSVNNGLFTVELNFPQPVWNGGTRYLEIQVGSTTLTPRVKLNPTPYAATLRMFDSGTSNPDRMVIAHSPSFTNWGLQYRDSNDTFHFLGDGISRVRIGLGDGLVGIGTASPATALDVVGTTRTTGFQLPTGASAGRVLTSDAGGTASWQDLPAGANVWALSGTNIYNTNTGNVGIGTTAPGYLLDVRGDRPSRLLFVSNTNTSASADGVWAQTVGNGSWAVYGNLQGTSGNAVYGNASSASGTAVGVRGRSASPDGHGGYFDGRVRIDYDSTIDRATLRLHETAADFARLEFTNTNTARKWHIAGLIGSAVANDRLNFWNSAAGDIMSIRGDGTVSVKVLEITGADLAEKFPTSETIEPGMVVEIDPENPGKLRLARGAYNRRVIGVVAGANGMPTGVVLGNLPDSETHTPIAMSGRVWVYADATERAIEPGDLLTTADRAGYAQAVADPSKAHGAILGKAMTGLKKGETGFVLVVVNLH